MTDYFDDDESVLFSSSDTETGGDENRVSKNVTEAKSSGTNDVVRDYYIQLLKWVNNHSLHLIPS